MKDEQYKELMDKIDEIHLEVKLIQLRLNLTHPASPPPPYYPSPYPDYIKHNCDVCGMNVFGMTNYLCTRMDCPGKVTCTTIDSAGLKTTT